MSEVAEKPAVKRDVILDPQRMHLSSFVQQFWAVDVEEGTSVEDVLNPAYWAHMASQMTMFDRIEARWETGERILVLYVTKVGRNFAQVFCAHNYDLTEVAAAPADLGVTHKILWKGPHKKHCVIRVADNALIQEGLSTMAEANTWLAGHLKTIGG